VPQVLIHAERCKACKLCLDACPQGVLSMGHSLNASGYTYPVASRQGRCLGCRLCSVACPDVAIEIRATGTRYEYFEY